MLGLFTIVILQSQTSAQLVHLSWRSPSWQIASAYSDVIRSDRNTHSSTIIDSLDRQADTFSPLRSLVGGFHHAQAWYHHPYTQQANKPASCCGSRLTGRDPLATLRAGARDAHGASSVRPRCCSDMQFAPAVRWQGGSPTWGRSRSRSRRRSKQQLGRGGRYQRCKRRPSTNDRRSDDRMPLRFRLPQSRKRPQRVRGVDMRRAL